MEAWSSSGRPRLAVNLAGGRDRGGVIILRAVEARGPPGGRAGLGRRLHPPGGGVSRSTGREGWTGEASFSWRRRLAESRSTGREGGTGKASSYGRLRLAVYRERGCDRGGVILQVVEARGPPGGWAGPGRRHTPGSGGTRSTVREGGTGEASSFPRRWRLAVHWEGGEGRGPPGGRVGPGRCRHHPGGGGSRSTGRDGGTGEASSSWQRC